MTATPTRNVLGEDLTGYRYSKGLTTREAGKLAGISHAQISRIERGTRSPKVSTLRRLCDAYGIPSRERVGLGMELAQRKAIPYILALIGEDEDAAAAMREFLDSAERGRNK